MKLLGRPLPSTTALLLAVIVLVGCNPATPLSAQAELLKGPEVARATTSTFDLLLGRPHPPAKPVRSLRGKVAAFAPLPDHNA